ncbi:MAG: type I 3-dehydroquinate dehydratase, partial [bacterium]
MKQDFPLNGVIGIIANHPNELDLALESGLQCVEVRADLLLDAGISLNQILELIQDAKSKGLASLMTLRHPSHGGTFSGTEDERVQINQKALEAGADLIDLEWASDASEAMVQKQAPMVISHHDFEGMLSEEELNDLTGKMEALAPRAIKVVPTAKSLSHSFQMLNWVSDAKPEISRIGFAMGVYGTSSRILTTVFGAPITYASFGAAVA